MASEQNPSGDPLPPNTGEPRLEGPQFGSPQCDQSQFDALHRQPQPTEKRSEDPPWTGWDVLQIVALTVFVVFLFVFIAVFAVHRLLYPHVPLIDVARMPLVSVIPQMLAYLVVLAFMVAVIKRRPGQSFWRLLPWNWPTFWITYICEGVVLTFALQGLAHFLPMPKELPIDRFFSTASEAWVLSIFAVTLAPLMEELFFRGFLYPVLARRLGVTASVLLTSIAFGLIHAPQLGRAWGPVLVVFLVGLVLTIVRAITKSVACGFLIHVAYNGTLTLLLFIASDGFRHLDKLK